MHVTILNFCLSSSGIKYPLILSFQFSFSRLSQHRSDFITCPNFKSIVPSPSGNDLTVQLLIGKTMSTGDSFLSFLMEANA